MPKRKPRATVEPQRGYNTNLASEFFVLSMLYRLGLDASLTLGNKKSVDISVVLGPGRAVTIDVKAVKGKMDWLMGNVPDTAKANHFVVLVSYDGHFDDARHSPRCWILRHADVLPLIKRAGGTGGMRYLSRKRVLEEFSDRESGWDLLNHAFRLPLYRNTTYCARWMTATAPYLLCLQRVIEPWARAA